MAATDRPVEEQGLAATSPRMRLYFDGWYLHKSDARDCLNLCVEMGGLEVGLVESVFGSWGIIYVSERVLFENHIIDASNALWRPVREALRA